MELFLKMESSRKPIYKTDQSRGALAEGAVSPHVQVGPLPGDFGKSRCVSEPDPKTTVHRTGGKAQTV